MRNEFLNPALPEAIAASMLVAVVPMLAPRVRGKTRSMWMTPIPTRGVKVDVKMELLCTKNVTPAPIKMAKYPVKNLAYPGKSALTTFLIMLAMDPCNREWRSFTMRRRHTHNVTRAANKTISPTSVSLRLVSEKRWSPKTWERERNILFNDALNTFYLRLYGVRHMVKDHSDSEKGNPLPPHRLLLSINSKGSFICNIPQTG